MREISRATLIADFCTSTGRTSCRVVVSVRFFSRQGAVQ